MLNVQTIKNPDVAQFFLLKYLFYIHLTRGIGKRKFFLYVIIKYLS